MDVRFAAATDPGRVRSHNEDRYVADHELGLFVVVDGMGGHVSGEVASATVADAIAAFIRDSVRDPARTWPFGPDPALSPLANRLRVAIRAANRTLASRVQQCSDLDGSGATLVAALFADRRVAITNVGDCRAYLLRGGRLTQVTRDHSLVAEQVALGLINDEDARHHPLRHVVTRAVSGDPHLRVDVQEADVEPDDRVLLCSDGVHGPLTDAELRAFAAADDRPLEACCAAMLEEANHKGGSDNATVVLIEIPPAGYNRPLARR